MRHHHHKTGYRLRLAVVMLAVTACGVWLISARPAASQSASLTAAQAEEIFLAQVWPVIEAQCLTCHSGSAPMSGLDLSSRAALLKGGTRGAGIIPGNAAASPLYQAIAGATQIPRMPPGRNKQLPAPTIAAFRQWIDAGAPWPQITSTNRPGESADDDAVDDTWAFRPIRRVAVPALGLASPVDNFIRQKLDESNLRPAPPADRVTLIRRATFDLHGLPPTPAEVAAFASDPLPTAEAFARVVERLLASPRYGERWGRHWLDVVRYADTGGGSNDYERPNAWRYRDYVIRSFNQDKPYDQFISEQIAGDEIDPDSAENLIATGFLRMGPWEHTGMSVEAVTRQEWLDDVTHNTATVFLGLTMGCAKCHNHKFDPIPAKDYYSLQAVFATTYFGDRAAPFLESENISRAEAVQARLQPKFARLQSRYNEIAAALGIRPRTQTPNQPAANTQTQRPENSQVTKPDQPAPVLKRGGADQMRAVNLELERAYIKRVEMTRLALGRFKPQAFSVRSDGKKTAADTFILIGGSLGAHGERVAPAVPDAPCRLAGQKQPQMPATVAGRRTALARWIAGRDNPLTARVMVNRIWQWHFGKGLVETSNNFGKLGKRPSHPELLDWLAVAFRDGIAYSERRGN